MNRSQLASKQETIKGAIRGILERMNAEQRETFTAEERPEFARLEGELKEVTEKLQQLQEDADRIASINRNLAPAAFSADGKGSIGERFINAKAWQEWIGRFPGRMIPDGAKHLMSPPVEFRSLLKELITGAGSTSAGAFVVPEDTGIYEPLGRYPRTLLDLISRGGTSSDSVSYVRQTRRVQEAAPVPEANITTFTGGIGQVSGAKPEGRMEFAQVLESVKTIAVWIPATKRALSDAAQLRTLIDQDLREDTLEELERQIYSGDGTGENFTGIVNTANVLNQAWDVDVFRTARLAKLDVEVMGRTQPTAFVLHPSDWAVIELTRDGENRYYYGGPLSIGEKRLWGLPVVTSMAVTEGTGLVANWRKARLWDREAATISMSDSHNDFFTRNMVAILCELRAAFGITLPGGFCKFATRSGT